jgi:peptide/nickel transport system permease protein
VTMLALDLPYVVTGAVIVETIFSWPGMGRLYYQSAMDRDYPMLMAILILSGALMIFSNLIADLIYGYLDPRIRYD